MTEIETSGATTGAVDGGDELEQLRQENAALRERLDEGSGSRGWRRRWISITCAVIAAVLVPMAIVTVWVSDTILDEDQYVETVAPLADQEAVQERVTRALTSEINEAVDFRAVAEDLLPSDLSVLAGPIAGAAESTVEQAVARTVDSEAFRTAWTAANRLSHNVVRVAVTGGQIPGIDVVDGEVVLDLSLVLDGVSSAVEAVGGEELVSSLELENVDAQVVLAQSDELASAQDALDLLDRLSWFVPLVALLFLIAAVVFAEDRRLGLRRLAIAVVASTMVALLVLRYVRGEFIDAALDVNQPFAEAVFDTLLRFLVQSLRVAAVVGLVLLAVVWLIGPSASAGRVRAWWDTLLGRTASGGDGSEPGAVPAWVAGHETALLGTVLVGWVLLLVVWDRPSVATVLWVTVIAIALLASVRFVGAVGRRIPALATGSVTVEDGGEAGAANTADVTEDTEDSVAVGSTDGS